MESELPAREVTSIVAADPDRACLDEIRSTDPTSCLRSPPTSPSELIAESTSAKLRIERRYRGLLAASS